MLIVIYFLDNFNKAWHKQIKEKYSSTDTEYENTKKSNKRPLLNSSDESSDEAGNDF